jgi:hypothetical protein
MGVSCKKNWTNIVIAIEENENTANRRRKEKEAIFTESIRVQKTEAIVCTNFCLYVGVMSI